MNKLFSQGKNKFEILIIKDKFQGIKLLTAGGPAPGHHSLSLNG